MVNNLIKKEIDVTKNFLVPKHVLMKKKEIDELLEKFRATTKELPKISISDPAIKNLGAAIGDIVRIERNSPTAGETQYYRRVIK
ncbi:MAG: DNA-directed RNA polymerase subunit H [Nanoarchaeota archaeon]|nr:DNA-directed RNA polymerase subunit H [Nanoarchaeota archaeon]